MKLKYFQIIVEIKNKQDVEKLKELLEVIRV
jgi:hypothetical protein